MNKLLMCGGLLALTCGVAQAAPSTYVGVRLSVDTPLDFGVGVQATYDVGSYALRAGADVRSLVGYTLGYGADASVLFPLSGTPNTTSRIQAGAGLGLERHSGVLTVLRPHLLLNGEVRLARSVTAFAEGSLGYSFLRPSGGGEGLGLFSPGLRVGLNFR
ncbi:MULTISPECIES: hypothetical protein [Deinococcus]|uniref:hypothetical protein n=1 Tax=Deinococcus TaxID=1298 RepID=UPI0004DACC1D|nr:MULTISPECIES: hypothetical protein [Deinococcus]KEF34574.1 hypothetical protein RDMS_06615 [Deinococcus sp. RL]